MGAPRLAQEGKICKSLGTQHKSFKAAKILARGAPLTKEKTQYRLLVSAVRGGFAKGLSAPQTPRQAPISRNQVWNLYNVNATQTKAKRKLAVLRESRTHDLRITCNVLFPLVWASKSYRVVWDRRFNQLSQEDNSNCDSTDRFCLSVYLWGIEVFKEKVLPKVPRCGARWPSTELMQ